MTERFMSTPLVAALLGCHRTMVRHLPDFPAPDVVIEGASGHTTPGWHRQSVTAWAVEHGREIHDDTATTTRTQVKPAKED